MNRAIPVTADDGRKRLKLLRLVVDALQTQAALCRLLGLESSTVSRWLSHERFAPDWHVVHAAISRTITRHPDLAAVFAQALLHDTLGLHGSWTPKDADEDCELSEGSENGSVRLLDPSGTSGAR
jgi:hypothetical protein